MTIAVTLPVLSGSSSLTRALTRMKKQKRSAVLVRAGDTFRLFTAGQVHAGLAAEVDTLADIETSFLGILSRAREKRYASKAGRTSAKKAQGVRVTSYTATSFLVQKTTASEARVAFTRRHLFTTLRSAPMNCYCTGARHHHDFPVQVQTGDDCPHCTGKIHCDD